MALFWISLAVCIVVFGPIAKMRSEPLWLVLPLLLVGIMGMILKYSG